ncbi:MAG: polysaccharide deacetylase family protein [Chthoniobacterales bacterium]
MKTRTLLLAYALLAPAFAIALLRTNLYLALAPMLFSHLLLLYATLVPNCAWWGPVATRFETAEPEVWLTIDDGPSPAHTARMLDLLDQFEARATFFVIGAKAEKHPHLITEILTRGHALANHTQTHPSAWFWCAGPKKIQREIARAAEHLRSTPERPACFFRAPAGMRNPFVHPALTERGLILIGWTVRGLDTVKRNPAAVAERIDRGIKPGAIILLHEDHRTQRAPEFNLRCLELTLQRLAARGYRCVIPAPEQIR